MRVLGLQCTHSSGVLAGSVPLSHGQDRWSSVPSPGKLETLQKNFKMVQKAFDFPPRVGGGSNGRLDLKGLVKKNPSVQQNWKPEKIYELFTNLLNFFIPSEACRPRRNPEEPEPFSPSLNPQALQQEWGFSAAFNGLKCSFDSKSSQHPSMTRLG